MIRRRGPRNPSVYFHHDEHTTIPPSQWRPSNEIAFHVVEMVTEDVDLVFYWVHVSLLDEREYLPIDGYETLPRVKTFTENFASDQHPKQYFFALASSISERFQAGRPRLDQAWAPHERETGKIPTFLNPLTRSKTPSISVQPGSREINCADYQDRDSILLPLLRNLHEHRPADRSTSEASSITSDKATLSAQASSISPDNEAREAESKRQKEETGTSSTDADTSARPLLLLANDDPPDRGPRLDSAAIPPCRRDIPDAVARSVEPRFQRRGGTGERERNREVGLGLGFGFEEGWFSLLLSGEQRWEDFASRRLQILRRYDVDMMISLEWRLDFHVYRVSQVLTFKLSVYSIALNKKEMFVDIGHLKLC
ncbi:hypothetical protein WN48_09124 [Eufriesea mexicana]|nr:hypothetical protein WN48_09124 [Eufriesea mexicana]